MSAQVVAHVRVLHREALDVGLVDDRVGERDPQRAVALPEERVVDDDRFRNRDRVVLVVDLEVGVIVADARYVGQHVRLGRPVDGAVDRLGVGIDEQLGRVEAMALVGRVRTVHAVAVALARSDVRQVAVPVLRPPLGHLDARLVVLVVEQAQLDPLGVLGEHGEVRAAAVPRGAERIWLAGPDFDHRTSTPESGGSMISASLNCTSSWVAISTLTPSQGNLVPCPAKLQTTSQTPRRNRSHRAVSSNAIVSASPCGSSRRTWSRPAYRRASSGSRSRVSFDA